MSAIDDLPPLRDVIRRHDLVGEEIARPEFPARPQPHRADRPRGRAARWRHRDRDRPRPRRADARAAGAGRAPRHRDRARRACAGGARGDRAALSGRLEVVGGDALDVRSARRMLGGARRRSSPTCPTTSRTAAADRLAHDRAVAALVRQMVLMFQREVAERIVAQPRTTRPMAGCRCSRTGALRPRSCSTFHRRPSCRSPRSHRRWCDWCRASRREPCDRRALEQVAAAAFGQRRKMLRQSLKSLGVDPARLAAAAGVDLTRRAETIPVSGFVAMARELINIRPTKPS